MTNKLIIFDLDGVLIDTLTLHFNALNKALSEIDPIYCITEKEQNQIYEGLSTNEKLKILEKTKGLSKTYHKIIFKNKQKYFYETFNNVKKDNDLINKFCIIKNNNINIAVATNSVRYSLDYAIQELGILELIDYSLSNEDVTCIKPNPEIYLRCMENFNCSPKQTVIYEDSNIGRMAAKKSGAKLIEVKNRKDLTLNKIFDGIKYLNQHDNV
jgi:HAD superfamily hydrolase (TIGR01509 family)